MESVTCQGHYQAITETVEMVKFLPVLLNLLLVLYTNVEKNKKECGKVVRVVLAVQYLYTGWAYCGWGLFLVHFVYALVLLVNFEGIFEFEFSAQVPYLEYSATGFMLVLQVLLNFLVFLPSANVVSVPYLLSTFTYLFVSRLSVIIQLQTNVSAVDFHFIILKYVPCLVVVVSSLYVCYFDNQIYFDHVVALGVLSLCMGYRNNYIEAFKEEVPKKELKKKKKVFDNFFEVRPRCDGGEQGKSSLPYYMDDDGDVANEFYEEVNKKLVKVSIDKLKLV